MRGLLTGGSRCCWSQTGLRSEGHGRRLWQLCNRGHQTVLSQHCISAHTDKVLSQAGGSTKRAPRRRAHGRARPPAANRPCCLHLRGAPCCHAHRRFQPLTRCTSAGLPACRTRAATSPCHRRRRRGRGRGPAPDLLRRAAGRTPLQAGPPPPAGLRTPTPWRGGAARSSAEHRSCRTALGRTLYNWRNARSHRSVGKPNGRVRDWGCGRARWHAGAAPGAAAPRRSGRTAAGFPHTLDAEAHSGSHSFSQLRMWIALPCRHMPKSCSGGGSASGSDGDGGGANVFLRTCTLSWLIHGQFVGGEFMRH